MTSVHWEKIRQPHNYEDFFYPKKKDICEPHNIFVNHTLQKKIKKILSINLLKSSQKQYQKYK